MYRVGVVGTSAIVYKAVDAFLDTKEAILSAVYSRHIDTGKKLAQSFGCEIVETNFNQFVLRNDIDIIYIASPNTFHFEQAKCALEANKHVVIEKPACVTREEWDKLNEIAHNKKCYMFEAIRHVYEPNFRQVSECLSALSIDGAVLNFGQYSRRMDSLLLGQVENIFKPEMSAGVLMDLGVYVLHSAFHWFGKPKQAQYFPVKYSNGIDIQGDMLLKYENYQVSAHISKRTNSIAPSEVYDNKQTITIDSVDHIKKVVCHTLDSKKILIDHYPEKRMRSEWKVFFEVLNGNDQAKEYYKKVHNISQEVITLMQQFRQENAIQFPADV